MRVLDCCWEDGISRSVAFSSPLHCRLHSSSVVCPPSWAVYLVFTRSACMHAAFMKTFRSHWIRAIDGRSNQPYFGIVSCANALYICDISSLYLFRGKVRGGDQRERSAFSQYGLAVRWCDCTFNLMKWPVCQIVSGRNRIVHRGMKAHGIVGIAELTKVRCILHILKEGHILAFLTPKCTLVSRQLMPWAFFSKLSKFS